MNFDTSPGEGDSTPVGVDASTRTRRHIDPAGRGGPSASEPASGAADGRSGRLSRRAAIARGAALGAVVFGGAGASSVVAGERGAGTGEQWKRLYQGTVTESLTYFSSPERQPTGEFAVEVRFDETAMLSTTGPPFAFELKTGALLGGDFVTFEPTNPYWVGPALTEGSAWIDTELLENHPTSPPQRAWELTYDAGTGDVQGALVQPSSYVELVNALVVGESIAISGDFVPAFAQINTQSTVEGTVGEDVLSLRFDIIDVEQTISATVDVTAERRA